MKITILFALGAALVMPTVAHAQTKPDSQTPPSISLEDFLNRRKTPGVRLFTTPGSSEFIGGSFKPKFTIEIVQQDSGAALRQIATVLGVNIVIDPAIQFLPVKTRTLYFSDVKGDVFDYLSDYLVRNEAVEKWKSSAGTYFFAAKPAKPATTLSELLKESGYLVLENEPQNRNPDPFVVNISPRAKTQVKPQPDWEKREFNGNAVYFIPVPSKAKSTESEQSK